MRSPNSKDWSLIAYCRAILSELILPLEGEAMLTEAIIMQIAHEEGLSADDSAFLLVLTLGEATEENWTELMLPF